MRLFTGILLGLLALVLGLTYHFGGIRLGLVTLTPTRMWNANGATSYGFLNTGNGVTVTGVCSATSGVAVFRLYSQDGTQVAGQQCPKGDWTINLEGQTPFITYRLVTEYRNYNGIVDISVRR
ncbi:hypothetical protein MF271_06390 [Deinococcus sp. KNUC1210]|uniref:hypothetical protein n=1 Tax=Deinococcus sp. KNUC1210 TaxID=2917691 RepID=UPI001EEFCF49|nr:hypothetical protein [Deinococcus sp. KNUC1210]ULH16233.1 hypothetical protein MF271_06390 [Deinococcus sp. KNUC1210]